MNRAELIKVLELVKPALSPRGLVPIFSCFTFTSGSVTAYNDTIAITGPCELEETCGIHGNTLLGMLNASSAEEVSIVLDEQDAVIASGAKMVSRLPFEPEASFIFSEPTDKWAVKLQYTESFHNALSVCLETVSSDETQVALHGVTVEGSNLFSCNGDTITRVAIKEKCGQRYLMPTAFCEAVVKLWSTLKITKGTLQFSDKWVFANFGDWAIYGQFLEIKDPIDFTAMIKRTVADMDAEPKAAPDGLVEALSRARVLADPESQKTQLTIAKGKMKLFTQTHMGEVTDEIAFKGHPDIKASVNAAYIHKALQRCDTLVVHENCIVLEKGDDVLLLVSNMG